MAGKNKESGKLKAGNIFLPFFVFFLFLQTHLVMSDTIISEDGTIPIDKGGYVYILADINKIRHIFDVLPVKELKSWQAVLVIEGTETAVAALFPKDSGRLFQLVGWGEYPSFRARIALFLHINWKLKHTDRGSYWYSNPNYLSVRIDPAKIYTVAWRKAHVNPTPEAEGTEIPEGFLDFKNIYEEEAPLSLWMEDPGSMLNQMFARERVRISIPSDRLFLNLYPAGNNLYKAVLKLQFRDEIRAENAAISLSSVTAFPLREYASGLGALFFSEPPFWNNNNLYFQTALLTENEVALLMNLFVYYWR
jgi:hypothetical protein